MARDKYDASWQCTLGPVRLEVWNDKAENIVLKNVESGQYLSLGLDSQVEVNKLLRLMRGK